MLVIISPAKSLKSDLKPSDSTHLPRFLSKSEVIVRKMSKLSKPKLKSLMHISDALAVENQARFQQFNADHDQDNSRPAVELFDGDVYKGMEVDGWNKTTHRYAQEHLRILSGLYGLLTPQDLIQPYRLEMGTKIGFGRKKNLYEFWRPDITQTLIHDMNQTKNQVLLNLASDEYWKAVDAKSLPFPVIKANFKAERDGKIKFISFDAKRARGMMAKWVFDHKIQKVEQLKAFNVANYTYREELSTEKELIFVRS